MRLTRRTRTTAWAVAFAWMVLVGSLALVDGLRAGADSVAGRFETGPAVYIRGTDLLESRIPLDGLAGLPDGAEALRVRAGVLEVNGHRRDVKVGSACRRAPASRRPGHGIGFIDRGLTPGRVPGPSFSRRRALPRASRSRPSSR